MSTEFSGLKDLPGSSYYLPPDEPDDDDIGDTDAWADYCAEARHVDRQHILDAVLSSLDTDDSPLYGLIDSCIKDPCEPGRARESLTVLAALGQALLDRVAASVDDAVNLRRQPQEVA
jgi:hypothetical protein